jgi:hypothetical protein
MMVNDNKHRNLVDASREVNLEINVEKTKHTFLHRYQNVRQNREVQVGNRSFKNVSQFKNLGTAVIDQNLIQEEIKRRLNSSNGNSGKLEYIRVYFACFSAQV